MTFLPQPYYLDRDDMVKFILAIPTTGWTWKPVGITWHNSGIPTLKQWLAYPWAVKAAWGANYDHYCKFDEGWHAGPHACGLPDQLGTGIVLGEFRANGVHSKCFNSDYFGIETIGDFRTGSDDPLSGFGLLAMQSSANIIAALCKRMGWDPLKVINFHRDCLKDGHPCPGNLVSNSFALGLVQHRMDLLERGPAPSPAVAPPAPSPVPIRPTSAAAAATLKQAVMAFQLAVGLVVDGDLGPLTLTAYERGLR